MKKKHLFICSIIFLSTSAISAIESLQDIQVGGVYQMELLSGEQLEGVVDDKNDSSLIIESKGTPFQFKGSLIHRYTLIAPPIGNNSPNTPRYFSFEELYHRQGAVGRIDILLTNGKSYKGIAKSIDPEVVKLDVGGSIIPISKSVISQISKVKRKTKNIHSGGTTGTANQPILTGPFDTVYIQNPKVNEYGKRFPPFVIIGKITSQDTDGIIIHTPKEGKKVYKTSQILRVNRNSTPSFEQKIKTYAQSLFCPSDMVLVDVPPGKEGRPFFKVCIDRYEYPNRQGAIPASNVSYDNAVEFCKNKGKRLCTTEEWQWSCSGLEGYTYPYGYQVHKTHCNREGMQKLLPSGSRHNCVGKFRVYDMVGNIFEWVTAPDGRSMLMGGPYSKCQTISPGLNRAAKPQIGLRCCKSN